MLELQLCEVARSDEHLTDQAILTFALGAQLGGMSRREPTSDERAAAAFAGVIRLHRERRFDVCSSCCTRTLSALPFANPFATQEPARCCACLVRPLFVSAMC